MTLLVATGLEREARLLLDSALDHDDYVLIHRNDWSRFRAVVNADVNAESATLNVRLSGAIDGMALGPLIDWLRNDPEVLGLAPGRSLAATVAGFGSTLTFWTARELSAFPSVLASLRSDRRTVGVTISCRPATEGEPTPVTTKKPRKRRAAWTPRPVPATTDYGELRGLTGKVKARPVPVKPEKADHA